MDMNHEYFMNLAMRQAELAFDCGEVPVGAVIVRDGRVIGRGYNKIESLGDATAHAEIIALTAASESVGDWRLDGCTLYVTLEPCLMCLGAILQSRISEVVYGASDPRLGAIDTHNYKDVAMGSYHNFPNVVSGILGNESSLMLKEFFRKLREK